MPAKPLRVSKYEKRKYMSKPRLKSPREPTQDLMDPYGQKNKKKIQKSKGRLKSLVT